MLTVAPAAGTLIQVGNNVAHAEAFKAGAQATRTLKFNVKADEKVNTKTETVGEPVDLIMIIDSSTDRVLKLNNLTAVITLASEKLTLLLVTH